MPITTTFDPPLPSDSPAVFNTKAFTLLGDLNTFSTEANTLQTEVNAKETTASAAATTATTQASNASASAAAAAASFDSFDDRYLGPKASDPTLDNDGNALLEGALYWNTTAKEMRAWNGTAWVQASVANAVSRTGDTMTGTLSFNQASATINTDTVDGADSKRILLCGGGAAAATRGGYVGVHGNEYPGLGGSILVSAGATGSEYINFSTGGLERARIDSSGNVGVGVTPTASVGSLQVSGSAHATSELRVGQSGSTVFSGAVVNLSNTSRSVALEADPTNAGANSLISLRVDGTEHLQINSTGNVLVTGSGGLGYGTGSGGTVTQATSKATAVTLNKFSGQITTAADALAAGATVGFIVNNSLVSATDAVSANGVNNNAYRVDVNYVAAGVFRLLVTNITGGSRSEALPISFQVHKGASS